MQSGGLYGVDDIPWFNGGLFQSIDVPTLSTQDLLELRRAADLNWSAIDVSIFGTLFERGLDPTKRSQLGAHYTDPATIERLIGPVIRRPLLQKWELVAQQIKALAAKTTKKGDKHYRAAHALFITWLDELKHYRALDPACGSGNFLYLALKCLKDVEHHSHLQASALGLDREADLVTGPHNVLGIELNEYAAELARVTVWIGELQWRLAHGYEFKTNPVLDTLEHIECRDALLAWGTAQATPEQGAAQASGLQHSAAQALEQAQALGSDHDFAQRNSGSDPNPGPQGTAAAPHEAPWPRADVVVGNPPFLGDKKMRAELGDSYTTALRKTYEGRVPGGADLVCYWFDKARAQMAAGQLQRAGLVATNVLSRGANRQVLDRVVTTTRIFEAWEDQEWVNEGAAVRVSLVCFGSATQCPCYNGVEVAEITADLKPSDEAKGISNFTKVQQLKENVDSSYFGLCLAGPFKVPSQIAEKWLREPTPHSKPNADVLKPIYNGSDLTRRWSGDWTIDFGARMSEEDASLYEAPFTFAKTHVHPTRVENKRASRAKLWWRHGEARPGLRGKLLHLPRYIATVETAKHRFFVFLPVAVAPEHSLIVIPRSDDVTFGILESRFHTAWTMSLGSPYGNHPTARRYNASRTFGTFPFPTGLTPADTAHQRTEAVDGGALIPAGLASAAPAPTQAPAQNFKPNQPPALMQQAQEAIQTIALHTTAIAIAQAAHRLTTLRNAWLNPPEWTQTVPEVVPLGMSASPYPDRTVAKPGFEKELAKRTLTNLYNLHPAWLAAAHQQLDTAVARAYGWQDYTADMEDDEILRRLLALNLERSGGG